MKAKLHYLLLLLLLPGTTMAGKPLVEFIQTPTFPQNVETNQTNVVFYTLRNNTKVTFPLTIKTSSPLITVSETGNTCHSQIAGLSTCVLPIQFNAPSTPQNVVGTLSVDYQGRAPLTDTLSYQVDPTIVCRLLPLEAYQTSFCRQQLQNVLQVTVGVFNTSGVNVMSEQTLGGMFGFYQRSNGEDHICYVSCGLKEVNGAPPDENTIFEIASITKTFTGSILGKKTYEGLVNPQESINPYLPATVWNGRSYNLRAEERPTTFHDLATFSGGVCFSDAPSVRLTDPTTQKQSDFVRDINLLNPASDTCIDTPKPNVKSEYDNPERLPTHNFYSNSSVGLVGQVLMNIDGFTQMDLANFNGWMCRHVLTPLNMNMTNGCLPSEAQNGTCPQTGTFCNSAFWTTAQYASGYKITNGTYELGEPFPYVPWAPAGALRSNTADMIKYVKANLGFSTGVNPDESLIIHGMNIAHISTNYLPVPPGKTVRTNIGSQKPLVGGQGFGWVCQPFSSDPNAICGKIGGHPLFRSFIGFSQSKQFGVIVLFNTGDPETDGSITTTAPTVGDIGVDLIQDAPAP